MDNYLDILTRAGQQKRPPIPEIVQFLNRAFSRWGMSLRLNNDSLFSGGQALWEKDQHDGPITKLVIDTLFPPVTKAVELYHYTKRCAASSILANKKLRLTSLVKRVGPYQGEIKDFCDLFGFADETSEQNNINAIALKKFYASFTETGLPPHDEEQLWNGFAESDGARFKFLITPVTNFDLRPMTYSKSASSSFIQGYAKLTAHIRDKYHCKFGFYTWSKLCAFFLGRFHEEHEIRMLVENCLTGLPTSVLDGIEFIEQPFGTHLPTGYRIDLLEVMSDCSLPFIEDVTFVTRTVPVRVSNLDA